MTRLTGTVTGPDGRPVAEAAVYFLRGPVPLPDVAQLTGEDGRYTLAAPAPGTYLIGVDSPDGGTATVTLEVGNEPEVVGDVRLG